MGNLMQQSVKNFGDNTLDRYITMFGENITLQKIQWRLESRKSFMLNKLQTRNVEIKKRQDKGEDYNAYLPDHLKSAAPAATETAAPAEAAASAGYVASTQAAAPAPPANEVASVQEPQAAAPADPAASADPSPPTEESVEAVVAEAAAAQGAPSPATE